MKCFLITIITTFLCLLMTGSSLAYKNKTSSQDLSLANLNETQSNKSAERLYKRASVNLDCPLVEYIHLLFAKERCQDLALTGEVASTWGDENRFRRFFKTASPMAREFAATRYSAIREACSDSQLPQRVEMTCTDHDNRCSEVSAYSRLFAGQVVICPSFKAFPLHSRDCRVMDQGMIIVALMSQLPDVQLFPTKVYAPDYTSSFALPAREAFFNSITQPFYAHGELARLTIPARSFIDPVVAVDLLC